MPTYDYACTECAHNFEAVQAFTDDALTSCPQCQGRLRKVFGNVGVVFKGSGFYRNDSRSAGAKTSAAKDSAPSSADSGSSKEVAATSGSDSGAGSTAKPDTSSGPKSETPTPKKSSSPAASGSSTAA